MSFIIIDNNEDKESFVLYFANQESKFCFIQEFFDSYKFQSSWVFDKGELSYFFRGKKGCLLIDPKSKIKINKN